MLASFYSTYYTVISELWDMLRQVTFRQSGLIPIFRTINFVELIWEILSRDNLQYYVCKAIEQWWLPPTATAS